MKEKEVHTPDALERLDEDIARRDTLLRAVFPNEGTRLEDLVKLLYAVRYYRRQAFLAGDTDVDVFDWAKAFFSHWISDEVVLRRLAGSNA